MENVRIIEEEFISLDCAAGSIDNGPETNIEYILNKMLFNDLLKSSKLTKEEYNIIKSMKDGEGEKEIIESLNISSIRFNKIKEVIFNKIRTAAAENNITYSDFSY